MKKAGEILNELGFRTDAPESLKEAFLRHLIESTTGHRILPGPNERKSRLLRRVTRGDQQLEFDFNSDLKVEIQTLDQNKNITHKKTS
jgi:hypothetical protein